MIGKNIQQKHGFKSYVLNSFPEPELFEHSPKIIKKASEAARIMGKLDGVTELLPDVGFFVSMYELKDATDSSQIEGTRATMVDAIEAEAKIGSNVPSDVDDISRYVNSLGYGLERLKSLPLSLRFLCEIHEKLMTSGARATHFSDPGNFRKTQNWINGKGPVDAEFVPPPVDNMQQALGDLEKFLHTQDNMPALIKTAIIHAQFETIHPFLDGNGRTGRMLIIFYLYQEKLLEKPVLYLSSYFKKYKKVYYQRLTDYRDNNVEKWVDFFLDGIIETAESAIETVRKITLLREELMIIIGAMNKTSSESAMKILPHLFALPIVSVATVQEWTGFTRAGAQGLIDRFVTAGILELKDQTMTYGRIYIYRKYLEIFSTSLE